MCKPIHVAFGVVATPFLFAAVHAQAPDWETIGSLPFSRHGFSLAMIGDYNGNGTSDVLIGEPGDLGAAFITGGGSSMVRDGDGSCITIFYGPLAFEAMGTAGASLPDIDGDGVGEILIGSPGHDTSVGSLDLNGTVRLYLGGTVGGGAAGCAGAGATPAAGIVSKGTAFPGNDGDEFGGALSALGDLNGDGRPEFIVGAPTGNSTGAPNNNIGYAEVYSPGPVVAGTTTLTLLYAIDGPAGQDSRYGQAVSGLTDVTGDGIDEFVVGAPDENFGGGSDRGRVRIYDGASGTLLRMYGGAVPGAGFGQALADMGDLDGDGLSELAVGAPEDRNPTQTFHSGSVTILLGSHIATGAGASTLYKRYGDDLYVPTGLSSDGENFGYSLANVGDLNGDAVNDLLVGAPAGNTWDPDATTFGNWPVNVDVIDNGVARLISGESGAVLKQYFENSSVTGDAFGTAVAGGQDMDLDGVPDVVIGAPFEDNVATDDGSVRKYSGLYRFGISYGTATVNSTGVPATIEATGSQSVNANELTLVVTGLPTGQTGIVFYGPGLLPLPGTPFGNGFLLIDSMGIGLFREDVVPTSLGTVRYTMDLTMPPSAPGTILPFSKWSFQFWFRDPDAGGAFFNLSNAVEIGFFQ